MEIKNLINDILNDCVSKSKLKLFYQHIINYNLNPDDYKYFTIEKETKKISIDKIKEKLFKEFQKPDTLEISDNCEEVLNNCDQLVNKIKYVDKKNKVYYYSLGKNLEKFKTIYKGNTDEFLQDRYNFKRSTLYKYIKFSRMCEENKILINCDLTFSEIMNNTSEIISLLK